jgi:hypothetical protein
VSPPGCRSSEAEADSLRYKVSSNFGLVGELDFVQSFS